MEINTYICRKLKIMELGIESTIKNGKFKSIKKFGKLLTISPKAVVGIHEPHLEITYNVNTAMVILNIGENHVAHLIMTEDGWNAIKDGAEVKIQTASNVAKNIKN